MKFIMFINVKMTTILGHFNIYLHDKYNIWKFERKKKEFLFLSIFCFMNSWNIMLSWIEHENVLKPLAWSYGLIWYLLL